MDEYGISGAAWGLRQVAVEARGAETGGLKNMPYLMFQTNGFSTSACDCDYRSSCLSALSVGTVSLGSPASLVAEHFQAPNQSLCVRSNLPILNKSILRGAESPRTEVNDENAILDEGALRPLDHGRWCAGAAQFGTGCR